MYLFDSTTINRTREAKYQIKKKYMYDYFSVRYQPGFNQDGTPSKEHPCTLKLVPIQNDHSENYRSEVKLSLINAEKALNFVYYPNIELKKIHGIPIVKYNNNNQQTYSIMTITSKAGIVYLPNEVYDFESLKNPRSHLIPMRLTLDRKLIQVVPEKRIGFDQPESSTSSHAKHTQMVETLVVYDYPCFAKCIHWVLANIFRVKPLTGVKEEENNKNINLVGPKRVFRDFTSNSDASISMDCLESLPVQGQQLYTVNYPPPTLNHIAGAPVEILSIESNLINEDSGPSTPTTAAMDSQLGTSSSSQQQDSSFKDTPSGLSVSGSDELKASLTPIFKKMRDGKEKENQNEQGVSQVQTVTLFDIKTKQKMETSNTFPATLSSPKAHCLHKSRNRFSLSTAENETADSQPQKDGDEDRVKMDHGKPKNEATPRFSFTGFGIAGSSQDRFEVAQDELNRD